MVGAEPGAPSLTSASHADAIFMACPLVHGFSLTGAICSRISGRLRLQAAGS